MKKLAVFLGSIVVLLGLAFGVLPALLGGMATDRLIEIADKDRFGQYVELELVDVDRAWFSSRVRMSVKPAGMLSGAPA